MVYVKPREGEPLDRTLKRFQPKVHRSGILTELRERRRYVKLSTRRRNKSRLAAKRGLRRLQ